MSSSDVVRRCSISICGRASFSHVEPTVTSILLFPAGVKEAQSYSGVITERRGLLFFVYPCFVFTFLN